MKVLLRVLAVLFVAIGAFLIYAVVNAVVSPQGARVGVCIGYVIAAAVLGFAASKLWRHGSRPATPS